MHIRSACRSAALAATILALSACGSHSDDATQQAPAATSAPVTQPSAPPTTVKSATANTLPATVLEAAKQGGHCSLDAIDGAGNLAKANPSTMKASQKFTASGWVVGNAMGSPSQFALILQGTDAYAFDGSTDSPRPDVAKALGHDAAGQSGFNISVNLGNTPAGTYKILALIKGQDGNEICDMQHQLIIGN